MDFLRLIRSVEELLYNFVVAAALVALTGGFAR